MRTLLGIAAVGFVLGTALAPRTVQAGEQELAAKKERIEPLAQRGLELLLHKPYLTPDFDDEVFDSLWEVWDEPARSQARQATPDERRALAFRRYGLTPRSNEPITRSTRPLQYVDDGRGAWVMNCFACHGGKVEGRVMPGAPNSLYDLQTLTEEVRLTKLRLGKKLTHMDKGSIVYPLSRSIGTTNAVMFGRILMSYRDPDLTFHADRNLPTFVHHDHDAPPWWHYRRKNRLYSDGFAPKSHRALLQFLLIPRNGPKQFQAWEEDYRAIAAWIAEVPAPRYSGPIDRTLAARGEALFERHCVRCHGAYGANGVYPETIVPIDELGTDRARLDSMGAEDRGHWGKSWFAFDGKLPTVNDPGGYVAPPLDGIWASAPYLHNGSVPTLWHLLHPADRPQVWKRSEDGYDHRRVGLEIESFEEIPAAVKDMRQRRRYFDTRMFGKSAAGHDFPDALDASEKQAVLEYLKTL